MLPGMWKADLKAAFRRMPIKKAHTWAAAVTFKAAGKVCFVLKHDWLHGFACFRLPGVGVDTQGVPVRGVIVCAWLGTHRQINNNVGAKSVAFALAALRRRSVRARTPKVRAARHAMFCPFCAHHLGARCYRGKKARARHESGRSGHDD